jgi:inorganic pyrophosphatase
MSLSFKDVEYDTKNKFEKFDKKPHIKTEKVKVYIEIEQFSNQKYEINKSNGKLELDRVLEYPYFYPYAYGFIPGTLAADGDDLDALIITDNPIGKDNTYTAYIVGVLVMEDEKGMDEKLLCLLEDDTSKTFDISDFSEEILENIKWFFENYKNKTSGKWSNVIGYKNKEYANSLYQNCLIKKSD